MRADWDRRAREDARHFVATGREQWTEEDFFASGERAVGHEILTDMENICQGKPPKEMRVLEIAVARAGLHGRWQGSSAKCMPWT